jgi:hypothetical protein
VEVGDVGPFALQERPNFPVAIPRPDNSRRERGLAPRPVARDLIIVPNILDNLVSPRVKQLLLSSCDDIFTAGSLVMVVNDQDFHLEQFP